MFIFCAMLVFRGYENWVNARGSWEGAIQPINSDDEDEEILMDHAAIAIADADVDVDEINQVLNDVDIDGNVNVNENANDNNLVNINVEAEAEAQDRAVIVQRILEDQALLAIERENRRNKEHDHKLEINLSLMFLYEDLDPNYYLHYHHCEVTINSFLKQLVYSGQIESIFAIQQLNFKPHKLYHCNYPPDGIQKC